MRNRSKSGPINSPSVKSVGLIPTHDYVIVMPEPETKTVKLTKEAHAALYEAQITHETFSETIIRLCQERKGRLA